MLSAFPIGQCLSNPGISNEVVIIMKGNLPGGNTVKIGKTQLVFNTDNYSYLSDATFIPIKKSEGKLVDTITIKTKGDYVLFTHKYNTVGYLETILMSGDSALIDLNKDRPIIKILNRAVLPWDENFQIRYREQEKIAHQFSTYEIFRFKLLGLDIVNKQEVKFSTKDLDNALKGYERELKFLDSLYRENLMSKYNFDYYSAKINIQSLISNIEAKFISKETLKEILIKSGNLSSSILTSNFYGELLKIISRKIFYKEEFLISTKSDVFYDSRKIFDLINGTTYLSIDQKKRLLKNELEMIARQFAKRDFETFAEKYNLFARDTSFANSLSMKYFSLYREKNLVDLEVLDNNKKIKKLDEVLQANKGKIIYVDFWASWCIPCRQSMENSHALRKMFSNKPVVFVYISLDKVFDEWVNASKEENLQAYQYNYVVMINSKSTFFKEMKLTSIPRYMIYDKTGKIIHSNAPGPDGIEVRKLLDKNL